MRFYSLLFLILSLIQTSLLPADFNLNLMLLVLISKSFISYELKNYYIALIGGLLLGYFQSVNLGFWALIYITVVLLTHFIRRLPISANSLTVIPVSLILITLVTLAESLYLKQSINFLQILMQAILMLPIFGAVRLWEERFVPKGEIKLKIKS